MNPPEFEMSLDHQMPVLLNKTQMSGDRAGTQCGLTSLLPMSCRGRAAAFARDLHSRLRNLGANQDDDGESSWLTRDQPPQRVTTTPPREADTFYDFELECESPSSPVDELESSFPERSPTDEPDNPFYDIDSEIDLKERAIKLSKQQNQKSKTNGFRFSAGFYTDASPVKSQPLARENGHTDKPLYAPISFEGIAQKNSQDEVDFAGPSSPTHSKCLLVPNALDSDSEFESAKSDPADEVDEVEEDPDEHSEIESENVECMKEISMAEAEIEDETTDVSEKESFEPCTETFSEIPLESITSKTSDKELSPVPEVDATLLKVDAKADEDAEAEIEDETTDVSEKESFEPCTETFSEIPLESITSKTSDKELSPVPEVDATLLKVDAKADEDAETEDERPQRIRRCSSLKTGKTPPGTPGRKKIVRFADVLGLDLADVKTFMDEIPVIPNSAYDDLAGCDLIQNSPPARTTQRMGTLTLVPLFQLPRDFTEKLERQNVCLETARAGDGLHITVCGSVRVRNLDYHKTVHIRYTMDRWKTYTDLQATYVSGSCDGFSDRFQFVLYAPCISSGQRLEIAVRFQCKGQQLWDNNSGANYCFDCLALGALSNGSAPSSGPLHRTLDWHPSFY